MQKKIPMRQCLGCREMKPKKELIRVVRSPEGAVSIDFRGKLPELGFALPDMPLSNCCTPLVFADGGAQEIYKRLRSEFGLTLCPSGGANADRILRVGHMGNLCEADYDAVEAALKAIR